VGLRMRMRTTGMKEMDNFTSHPDPTNFWILFISVLSLIRNSKIMSLFKLIRQRIYSDHNPIFVRGLK
jgi:hypothetical protein